jgi:hypothetical protein
MVQQIKRHRVTIPLSLISAERDVVFMSVKSPLARLVFFLILLSAAGSVLAGIHYAAIDLPAQHARQVPANSAFNSVPSAEEIYYTNLAQSYFAQYQECVARNGDCRDLEILYNDAELKRSEAYQRRITQ